MSDVVMGKGERYGDDKEGGVVKRKRVGDEKGG